MSKKLFLFGTITSVIAINSVFADATITTKNYVDTTRQATIPASGTNANTPGETVVTYTDTAGTIGERGIFNPETDYDENGEVVSGHEGDLVTADFIASAITVLGDQIQQATNETTVTYKKCTEWLDGAAHTDQNCILWNLTDKNVYGRCTKDSDCNCSNSPDTPYGHCNHGACRCVDFEPGK